MSKTITVNGTEVSASRPPAEKLAAESLAAGIGAPNLLPGLPGPMVFTSEQTITGNKESLGTQITEGVNAEGSRTTSTIEAGAIGNDRPIQIVSERWYSPELQTALTARHNDPATI
jgi:hypothetical protein